MTWSIRTTHIAGRDTGLLIDDRFGPQAPVRELPFLAWFGVFCRMDPGGACWHPDETEILGLIERDLIGLCQAFGRGWVVYVMRLDSPGIREYYFYHGADAQLDKVLPSLKVAHPEYRIEFEVTADADWSRYREFLAVPN